jgi:RNA recognition motif-containing protein
MNIYVGNLPFETDDEALRSIFEKYGEVSSAKVIVDQYSGRSRGFAFVEMPNDEQANAAIEEMNGNQVGGRTLKVSEARPRTDRRPPRRDGGGGGGRDRY